MKFHTLKECQYGTLTFVKQNYGYIKGLYLYAPRYMNYPLMVLFEEAAKEGIKFKSYA